MIKRIYIDNFKCFVNFEMNFESINLLLGPNGAGKSSVFEVLHKIQEFIIGGKRIYEIFSGDDITRWQKHTIQTFELEIKENSGIYKYELAIEYQTSDYSMQVKYERLWFNSRPLIKFESNTIQFYAADHSEGQSIPFDNFQSVIALFSSDSRNNSLRYFKKYIEKKIIVIKINPLKIHWFTSQEEKNLSINAENFISWYRYISQDQGKTVQIINHLREALDGFSSFRFIESGEKHRIFKIIFSDDNKKSTEYRFFELSDGQRVLIILYTLLYATKGDGYTLCIDEPENFLALPEIQPWLTTLYDYCNEGELQALLISHHPELINYLAVSSGYWLDRQKNGPVRVKRITEDESGLPISELVARGWLYE